MNNKSKANFFKHKSLRFYFKLFLSTLVLSAFTIGGGYVIVALMQKKFVSKYKWITEKEMLDYVAIGQSAPGVLAINVSILIGYNLAGILGAVITILGMVIPPLVIISVVSCLYSYLQDNIWFKSIMLGLQCGVAAIMIDVVINMIKNIVKDKNIFMTILMITSFVLIMFLQVNVILVILASILLGIVVTLKKRGVKK